MEAARGRKESAGNKKKGELVVRVVVSRDRDVRDLDRQSYSLAIKAYMHLFFVLVWRGKEAGKDKARRDFYFVCFYLLVTVG
jgi:hypothetical protein